jgi:eukaryotic-like serine/threonine-protein kinase
MTVPARLGRYEIVRRIGNSMTDVYLAIDTVENRKAALKLIERRGDNVTQMMLEAERRGAAIQKELRALDPRIVEIYDFGDLDGYFFVAMQYIEGRNLSEVLRAEGSVNPQRAAVIALELCEQLAKFHSRETASGGPLAAVVHGDIKPSNIHLGPNGTVRLLDFGIAKMLRAGHDATAHDFGSPSYCSPERLERSLVDQQSDLWAVGVTLYEMLAGSPPYQAESTAKLENLIRSRRPPKALPPGCPPALRTIASKALAPEPGRRYRSAREFQADLQAFLEGRMSLAEANRRSAWSASATLAWSASATIEVARECWRRVTRTVRRSKRWLEVAGAIGWFATGMALWLGGSLAWQLWHEARTVRLSSKPHPVAAAAPSPAPPAPAPSAAQFDLALREAYLAAANQVVDAYRAGADPPFGNFDWQKAQVCYERAVQLGAGGNQILGRLALSQGYAGLDRVAGGGYSGAAAAEQRRNARNAFLKAQERMPSDPEPHLALARLYAYWPPDADKATAEFAAAERLGHTIGRRDTELEGDAYRLRASQEAAAARSAYRSTRAPLENRSWQDAETARRLYRRIPGFGQTGLHLRELDWLERSLAPSAQRRSKRWE